MPQIKNDKSEFSTYQVFFCKILINDLELHQQNIVSLNIREWVFEPLPRLEMVVLDDGVLSEYNPLSDNTIIKLQISKDKVSEEVLDIEFDLIDYSIDIIGSNSRSVVNISGLLRTNNIFNIKNRVFRDSTSIDVANRIATESGLEFNKKVLFNTNDTMSWIQSNISNFDMLKYINKKSFINNDALFFYGTTQGDLQVNSIRSALKNSSKIARYDLEKATNFNENLSDIYFNSYDVVNYNGHFNRKSTYGIKYNYYDLVGNVSNTLVDNIGNLTDNENRRNTQLSKNINLPIQSSNTYKQYNISSINNKYYKELFFGMSILLNINSHSAVRLFDKVSLSLPSLVLERQSNDVFTGDYLVGGITHNITKNSIYRKRISLHRFGYNTPELVRK